MAEKQEVLASQKLTTQLSWWTNTLTGMVTRDFDDCGVPFDKYSKQCAMAAMTSIYQLVKNTDSVTMENLDTSNLREIVGQAASLKLNANAVPRECYFQLRTKKVGNNYIKIVEMGIEGDGNDAMLRNYGENVDTVYPCWLVKEGDEFIYPKHRGVDVDPPAWEEKGLSQKTVRVVYPVKLKDGNVQYLIAEREGVKVNLIAHIRNNMMNETFGICENRYKAAPKQLEEIKQKKEDILNAVRACETLEDILSCEIARPFISAAWLDTPENMIIRKMRNNAIKKFRKNYNPLAKQSIMQLDETYQVAQAEIAENANKEEFTVIDAEVVATDSDSDPKIVKSEIE